MNNDFIIDSDEEEEQKEKEQFSSRSPLKRKSIEDEDGKNNGFDTFRKNCSPQQFKNHQILEETKNNNRESKDVFSSPLFMRNGKDSGLMSSLKSSLKGLKNSLI